MVAGILGLGVHCILGTAYKTGSLSLSAYAALTFLLRQMYLLLRARRNEKDLKVKPATSFKYFQYLLTKN